MSFLVGGINAKPSLGRLLSPSEAEVSDQVGPVIKHITFIGSEGRVGRVRSLPEI